MTLLTWFGILLCLSHSAMFSSMNLGSSRSANWSSRWRRARATRTAGIWNAPERQPDPGNHPLGQREVNVLLSLLPGSLLTGAPAFLFSGVVIAVFAEIIHQAYLTRHALQMASLLARVLRFYSILLYPIAWPTARALDA